MLLYYITDRKQFPGDASAQEARLLEVVSAAAQAGVDFIQLREKDLTPRELESLARKALAAVRDASSGTNLLINSRMDVAIATGADGVHLTSSPDELRPDQARVIFAKAGIAQPVIGASCHSAEEVARAESYGADFGVLAPIFQKQDSAHPPLGIDALRAACSRPAAAAAKMPVLALGGVTLQNAQTCMEAGAAGIAGIRLFQESPDKIPALVTALRNLRAARQPSPRRHPYKD